MDSPVTITDLTGDEGKYKLDVQGFQFVKHKSRFIDHLGSLKSRYSIKDELDETSRGHYAEMEALLRDVLASTR